MLEPKTRAWACRGLIVSDWRCFAEKIFQALAKVRKYDSRYVNGIGFEPDEIAKNDPGAVL